jgi:hypothetical protein
MVTGVKSRGVRADALAPRLFETIAITFKKEEYWSNGRLEYWIFSITPLLHNSKKNVFR